MRTQHRYGLCADSGQPRQQQSASSRQHPSQPAYATCGIMSVGCCRRHLNCNSFARANVISAIISEEARLAARKRYIVTGNRLCRGACEALAPGNMLAYLHTFADILLHLSAKWRFNFIRRLFFLLFSSGKEQLGNSGADFYFYKEL